MISQVPRMSDECMYNPSAHFYSYASSPSLQVLLQLEQPLARSMQKFGVFALHKPSATCYYSLQGKTTHESETSKPLTNVDVLLAVELSQISAKHFLEQSKMVLTSEGGMPTTLSS